MLSADYLREMASSFGLQLMAAIPVNSSGSNLHNLGPISRVLAELEEDAKRFDSWRDSGFGAGLEYLNRRSGKDLINPNKILFKDKSSLLTQDANHSEGSSISVLMFCIYYSRAQQPTLVPGFGRVARYAWGRDYHKVLGKRLKALAKSLEEQSPGAICRGFTDAIPLMERAFGRVAKLGFIGKNTLLIQPGRGSFSLLAGIAISREVEPFSTQARLSSCGSCSRCIKNCPTGALVQPYTLDARRCISYLTIEKRGALSLEESCMLGEWVFGCDICQEVCPFNERAIKSSSSINLPTKRHTALRHQDPSWKEFEQESGVGPLLSLGDILMIRSDEQFVQRFQGTPIMRAKREGLLRNAACVAANTRAIMVKEALEEAAFMDSSTIVREQAARAIRRLWG